MRYGFGMLVFALAPCYCVFKLAYLPQQDEDDKARRRAKLSRQLKVENPFEKQEAILPADELARLQKELR